MPVGFIRRIARQSLVVTYVSGSNSFPVLTDNWTTQETNTYDANDPADSPSAWGGTVANLDREFTETGSANAALGMLLTFVTKPPGNTLGQTGSFGGVIVKLQPTFIAGSAPAIEVWSLAGATWTKRRRVSLAGRVRSGDTLILDLTGPVLSTDDVDAYWITMAPDDVGDAVSWLACHVYGICLNDPVTPDCPPGTPPEDCEAPECGVDFETWVCLDPPEEPDPAPPTDPFTLPPILVQVPNPTTYTQSGAQWFHNCPRPTIIRMEFGELPSGGSVTVRPAPSSVLFAEGTSQTISAPGTMTWTVSQGFQAANAGADPSLPPAALQATTDFYFTRELAGSAFAVAGNLLDILMYFWSASIGYQEVC